MACCGFSDLFGGECGAIRDNQTNNKCVTLRECQKDICNHLVAYRVSDDSKVDTELKLLLARAGNVRDSISSVRFVLSEYIINSDDVMISSGKEKQLFLFLNRYIYS